MIRRTAHGFCVAAWLVLAGIADAGPLVLVTDGEPAATILAPKQHADAADRLARRLEQWTGARLPIEAEAAPDDRTPLVAVGTPEDNAVVEAVCGSDPRIGRLGGEGYLIKASTHQGRPVLVAAGAAPGGVHNAVSQLLSWQLRLGKDRAWVDEHLDESAKPALKYRLLWTWTMGTNWATSAQRMHEHYTLSDRNRSPGYAEATDGLLTHYKRAIDFYADHKLNGLIVWHWLHDHHGGVETGRELSRYAKQNNVRLLPGIGTASYGGFFSAGQSPWCMTIRLRDNPDQRRFVTAEGGTHEMPCSTDPEHQKWLQEGARWYFETFPDVGGANLEQGDFQACQCEWCRAARGKPQNDPNCFYDMMVTQQPVVNVARELRPDAWMIFATYIGFREDRIVGGMQGQIKAGNATGVVYPPRFMKQYPDNAICQWTLSFMATPDQWPQGLAPPKAEFDQIGLLHEGSGWDRKRWWAWGDPQRGALLNDASKVIRFVSGRVHEAGMQGLVIYGEVGDVSPANELNYVAMEYFTWHPDRSWDSFVRDRLAHLYGGREAAERFLAILDDSTTDREQIQRARAYADKAATDDKLNRLQGQRWINLRDELGRRLKMLAERQDKS